MHFGVLGPLRVIAADGTDVTPRGHQQRRVLTALVAASPGPVAVGALEELLWQGPAPSANALHAIVSKLRRLIAPVAIESSSAGYALIGEFGTDIAELTRLAGSGRFAEAERLVRGEPLQDIADDLATAAERARLSGEIQAVRHKRLESAVLGAAPLDAIAELQSLVIREPHDEAWWALLMQAQQRCGMQAEALRSFQRARRVLADELGLEPGAELQELERQILTGAAAYVVEPAPARRPPSLPARLSSFVGRSHELATLADAVQAHRLVTLVGPGGTGKTTTALELVRRTGIEPAAFLSLSPLTDGDAIVRALARGVGLPDTESAPRPAVAVDDDPLDRVVASLGSGAITLVVDNCEHVLEEVAPVVHRLLVECPGVRVVATSRASLGIPGEHVHPLPPMTAAEAVELFVERARDHAALAAVESVDAADLVVLCERLDRLPLAIELAAARLRAMTVAELAARLDDRFSLLSSGPRTVEPRQQTLRAVVDWSYGLLDPVEQLVFRRLSVFVGGASAEAVEFVGAGGGNGDVPPGHVLSVVDRLLDKSLLRAARLPSGTRFFMLQTIHDYAAERLAQSGEQERVLVRHAEYYAELIAGATRGVIGRDQSRWLELIRLERDNIDAARATAIARQDAQLALELVAPLGWFFFMTGEIESGAEALADALACPGPTEPALRALALGSYGWLMSNGAHVDQAVASTSEAMALLDRVDDGFVRGHVLNVHTMAMFFSGRIDVVRAMLPDLEQLAAESDDAWTRAMTKLVQGELLQFAGTIVDAERLFLEAANELESAGDRFAYALTITEASEIAELFGEYDRAAEYLQRGIEIAEEAGFSANPLAMRARLGNVEMLRGNFDVAEAQHRALLDDPVACGVPWLHAMSLVGLSNLERRRGRFAESDQLLRQAWAMPRTKVVPFMRSLVLVARGYLADQQGDHALALEHQLDALRTVVPLNTPRVLAHALEGCAGALAADQGHMHAELAARLLGASDRIRRDTGGAMPPGERFDVDRAEARLRGALGDVRFARDFAAGAGSGDVAPLVAELTALAERIGSESPSQR